MTQIYWHKCLLPIGMHGWFFDRLVFRSITAILWCGVYFRLSYIYHMWSSHCPLIQYEVRLFLSRWNISLHTTNNIICKISCLLSDFSSYFIVPVSWLLRPFKYLLFNLSLFKDVTVVIVEYRISFECQICSLII